MGDNNKPDPVTSETEPLQQVEKIEVPKLPRVRASQALRDKVNELASGDVVKEKVSQNLADIEVQKRASAVATVLKKIDDIDEEIDKIKPIPKDYKLDNGKFVPAGEPTFTPAQKEQYSKLSAQKEKLETALDKTAANDFRDVFKLASGKGDDSEGKQQQGRHQEQ